MTSLEGTADEEAPSTLTLLAVVLCLLNGCGNGATSGKHGPDWDSLRRWEASLAIPGELSGLIEARRWEGLAEAGYSVGIVTTLGRGKVLGVGRATERCRGLSGMASRADPEGFRLATLVAPC